MERGQRFGEVLLLYDSLAGELLGGRQSFGRLWGMVVSSKEGVDPLKLVSSGAQGLVRFARNHQHQFRVTKIYDT